MSVKDDFFTKGKQACREYYWRKLNNDLEFYSDYTFGLIPSIIKQIPLSLINEKKLDELNTAIEEYKNQQTMFIQLLDKIPNPSFGITLFNVVLEMLFCFLLFKTQHLAWFLFICFDLIFIINRTKKLKNQELFDELESKYQSTVSQGEIVHSIAGKIYTEEVLRLAVECGAIKKGDG